MLQGLLDRVPSNSWSQETFLEDEALTEYPQHHLASRSALAVTPGTALRSSGIWGCEAVAFPRMSRAARLWCSLAGTRSPEVACLSLAACVESFTFTLIWLQLIYGKIGK